VKRFFTVDAAVRREKLRGEDVEGAFARKEGERTSTNYSRGGVEKGEL